jgi:hypothetical protein
VTVSRLQAELSAAIKARTDATLALAAAEKTAAQARSEADIARRELETARNEANAASEEIDRLKGAAGPRASYVKEIIVGGIFSLAILFLLIRLVSRMRAAPEDAAGVADGDAHASQGLIDGELEASPATAPTEAATPFDEDDVVKKLAMTLGVEEPLAPAQAVSAAEPEDAPAPQDAASPEAPMEDETELLVSAPESVPAEGEVPEPEAAAAAPASAPPEKTPTA